MYAVRFHPAAARELEHLEVRLRRRIAWAIDRLAADSRAGATRIRGAEDLWRLRVGDYRVIYQVRDDLLLVLTIRVRHRREAYR